MNSRISSGLLVMGLVLAMPAIGEDSYGNSGYDYADVINVDPLYRDVRVSVPRQECRVEVHEEPGGTYHRQGARPRQSTCPYAGRSVRSAACATRNGSSGRSMAIS